MIVCPNCNHQNPDGAVQCEACYTPLPAIAACPNCGAMVQTDASFCGQCGFNLRGAAVAAPEPDGSPPATPAALELPERVSLDPLVAPEPLASGSPDGSSNSPYPDPMVAPAASVPTPVVHGSMPEMKTAAPMAPEFANEPKTQLQQQRAQLLHVQTNVSIELPQNVPVIHMGKPNDRIPPDVDVSGFPNSEIVSRIHADIRVEGDAFYIEDVGSSNGTYINNAPLPLGNRHRLRTGDRIGLGKGDKVSFLFILS